MGGKEEKRVALERGWIGGREGRGLHWWEGRKRVELERGWIGGKEEKRIELVGREED